MKIQDYDNNVSYLLVLHLINKAVLEAMNEAVFIQDDIKTWLKNEIFQSQTFETMISHITNKNIAMKVYDISNKYNYTFQVIIDKIIIRTTFRSLIMFFVDEY